MKHFPGFAIFVAICLGLGVASAQTVELGGHVSDAVESLNASHLAPSAQTLHLSVILALRNQAALDKLLDDLHNPASPEYEHWLTPEQFNARFGPAQDDFDEVVGWLKSEGFNVVSASLSDRTIRADGPVWMAERAFGAHIVASDDERAYGNLDNPVIPARFAGVIGSIDGLDNLRHSMPLVQRSPKLSSASQPPAPLTLAAYAPDSVPAQDAGSEPNVKLGGGRAFGPADLRTFYDENTVLNGGNNGNKQGCFALIEDSNFLTSAVNLFNSTFKLPAASITRRFPTTNPGINGDETETLIDVEWGHVVAPGSALNVYIGNPSGKVDPLVEAISLAVKDNSCSVISISFGYCGASKSFFTVTLDPLFKKAAAQGQSVFVSSGDSGAADLVLDSGGNACVAGTSRNVNEMSADPNVTSVGGTEFNPTYNSSGNDVSFVAEKVWNENTSQVQGAGGGGMSAIWAKPAYQSGKTPADKKRDVPDVSMIASPDLPGVWLGDDNGGAVMDCCWGGTSLAAPVFAGVVKLWNQKRGKRSGNINLGASGLYASQLGLRDVKSGNNNFNGVTGFSAVAGYDRASGWGTADIAKFLTRP
ncbi:MAG: S53 family peptidase [Candidatus Binataceae bacterium]